MYNGTTVLCGAGDGYIKYSETSDVLIVNLRARLKQIVSSSLYLAIIGKNKKISYVNIGTEKVIDKTIEHKNIFAGAAAFAICMVGIKEYMLLLSGGFRGDRQLELALQDFFCSHEIYLGKSRILSDIKEVETKPNVRRELNEKLGRIEAIFDKAVREDFYESVKGQLQDIFSRYEKEENLQRLIGGSKWAKIRYGKEHEYYTVGVIFDKGKPSYICYGVPTRMSEKSPAELEGYCEFLPVSKNAQEGYWMMYQNADSGELIALRERA